MHVTAHTMTAMRKGRLQRLESHRRANKPWFYPYPLAIRLLTAVAAEERQPSAPADRSAGFL